MEKFPRPEFSEKEQVLIARLLDRSPDKDAESRAMLIAWCKEEEARVTAENTSRANVEFQLKLAKLYRAAGGYDSAWQTLAALCESETPDPSAEDLYQEAMVLAAEIRNKLDGQSAADNEGRGF